MADERIVTNIVANADFSNLIADVHKVTASLSKLQEQMANSNKMLANNIAVMNRNFSDTLRSTGQFSTHFVSLTSDVEKFGKNLDGGKLKLRQYFDAFQQHAKTSGGVIRDLAKQQVALQNAILQPLGRNAQGLMQFNVQVPRGLDATRNKAALARQELQIMNKVIQEGANQLINWGKNTQWAGRQLTVGLTVPMAAFGKAAADAFKAADQELTRLAKVYGGITSPTQKQLATIRKDVAQTANELAKAYGTGYTETIALAADIAATGKEGNDLLKATKETTRLAVLGEVDKQTAMKATLSIQTAFKQNTDQLSESINFLNAVENQTSTTLQDLIEAIPKAGPVVQGLGGSVKDLALYLTAMKEGGVSASEGANALKSALASLINPTKTASDMFAGFGIDLRGIVTKDAGNLTQTILDLQAALDQLNPLQKQQALEQLFGKFQFARMNALFENLGRQGSQTLKVLDLMKSSSQDLANIAGRELSQVTESASGRYKRAIEGLKADLAGVGEQFLQINTAVINIIDRIIKFANNLPKPLKQLLALVGGITAVAGPLIMLTGVLANFFGYIVKGISHMRSFFRGGEGWKYLTPEMLAAEKAGSLVEKTFYSDAKAASVLQLALKNLIDEFTVLEAKAKSGAISVGPTIQTMAGNIVTPGVGPRVVDPRHPLVGQPYSRASTHMVPRSGMTDEERMAQTMFGFVPGSIPVNRKIGNNPQIYTNENMPNVPGLTTINGTSTGVIAGEAAKWHSMMAALGMQSKQEIEALKKEIATTGLLSKDFMATFETILPTVSALTNNAATESAAIVAELRAGKINVDQARQQIIALNLQVERDIASAAGAAAASMGRTINPTVVPTLNQPVVDPSGKSNMRELFKKGKTRDLINKIAGALGVRTSGAGYNIETTIPKKFALGGPVYMSDGGPHGTDTVPAWLSEGEYVLRKKAVDVLGVPLLNQLNSLDIDKTKGPVGAHASLSMPALAHELPDMYGNYLPKGTAAFAKALPDHPVEVFDSNILGLFSEENQALRKGHRGLTRIELIRALAAPNSRLFKYLPKLTPEQQKLFKRRLLEQAKMLPEGRVYHDDALAQIYNFAKKDTLRLLSGDQKESFRETMSLANRAKGFRPASFSMYTGGQQLPIMTADEARMASGDDPFFYMSPKSASGKSGKTTAIITDSSGNKQSITTSGSKLFKAGIRTDPRYAGRLNIGRVVTPYAQKMLRMAWMRGHSNGGYIGSGGPQGYALGGMVKGMLGGTAVTLGGQMLGNAVGGGLGSAISMGSGLLGSMIGFGSIGRPEGQKGFMGNTMDKMLGSLPDKAKQPIGPFNNLSKTLMNAGQSGGKFAGILEKIGPRMAGILKLTSPLGLGITATTLAVSLGIKAWKDHNEQLRLNRLGYGMTAESAAKAGMKYTDYNSKIKEAIANAKAMAERNHMIYESMTSANVPMKMTIEQYKKLKETVKSTMGDYIKLFSQTDKKDVGAVAIRLKAQFMAAGDSAEVATAKIYALIAESKNSSQAASAIGSKAFQGIQTLQDAATQSIKTFGDAVKSNDVKAQSDSLLTAFQAIDSSIEDTVKKSADAAKKGKGNAISVGEATKQQIDAINKVYKDQPKISDAVINELKKQNPELAKILNSTDTVTSAWAKQSLILKGLNMDLSGMTGKAAEAALAIYNITQQTTQEQLKQNASTGKLYTSYDKLSARIKELQKAAKGQSAQQQIDTRKTIEGLNKQIDAIKKAAQEKIDAIRKQKDAENTELAIQKKQLEAQQALARGDMAAYSAAQLDVQQITNDAQAKAAEEAITKKAELDIAPLQKQIDALNSKNQTLADKAAIAGESLGKLQEQADKLKSGISSLETLITNITFKRQNKEGYVGSQEEKDDLAALYKTRQNTGTLPAPAIANAKPGSAAARYNADVAKGGTDLLGSVENALKNGVNAQTVNIYAKEYKDAGKDKGAGIKVTSQTMSAGRAGTYTTYSVSAASLPNYAKGSTFKGSDGKEYKVSGDVDRAGMVAVSPTGKAKGGPVLGGTPYIVGEKGPELFVPSASGSIIPNNIMGPRFDLPGRAPIGTMGGGSTNSYNNNTYNIDIALNGTNVTADDVVRRFKQELALVNAKEGRSKYVGGSI